MNSNKDKICRKIIELDETKNFVADENFIRDRLEAQIYIC